MSDKSTGILTSTDREFLSSDETYYTGKNDRQQRYERKKGIRGRIISSILDFSEIRPLLEDDQRERIFTEPEKNGAESQEEFQLAIESLLQWLYLGCREAEIDFDQILRNAVVRGEEDYNRIHGNGIAEVEVNFDVEVTNRYSGVEELARALENGETIPARYIYKIPMVPDVPVDPEKVETVYVGIMDIGDSRDSQVVMMETILKEHLDLDVDVEIQGRAEFDIEEST
jgi:hypothetical protein